VPKHSFWHRLLSHVFDFCWPAPIAAALKEHFVKYVTCIMQKEAIQ
jgi:hypothetical protein